MSGGFCCCAVCGGGDGGAGGAGGAAGGIDGKSGDTIRDELFDLFSGETFRSNRLRDHFSSNRVTARTVDPVQWKPL